MAIVSQVISLVSTGGTSECIAFFLFSKSEYGNTNLPIISHFLKNSAQ